MRTLGCDGCEVLDGIGGGPIGAVIEVDGAALIFGAEDVGGGSGP